MKRSLLSIARGVRFSSSARFKAESDESDGGNYLSNAFVSALIVCVVLQFFPGDIAPFKFLSLWETKGSLGDWLEIGRPVLAWGGGLSAFVLVLTRNSRQTNNAAEILFIVGALMSLWAGVVEEICFRWLIFLGSIVITKVLNFLFFGWLGFGLLEWFYNLILGPFSNFLTWGHLAPFLRNPELWYVGMAMISTNAAFRDGHKYQGFFGWANSWFLGMYFFWVTLNYGIVPAMFIHFLYDLIIDVVKYIDMVVERLFDLGE